jgi:uncharacterized integral membrane protein
MSVLHRPQRPAEDPAATTPPPISDGTPSISTTKTTNQIPRTRTSAIWVGICAGALTLVVLIVFMLQNTRSVEVTFLWMHGNLPLALALLIAGVGVGILAMVVGAARITQLRHLPRQPR